ncbi:MAG: type IV pilin protein [Pseudomonadota bacterium]
MKTLAIKKGMTVIELLVAIIIIAILSFLAVVIYTAQIRNSRRTDAVNTIFSIALAEESYRTTNTAYGSLANVWSGVTTSVGGYYTLAISNVAATSYTITATATGDQVNDTQNGTACSSLVYAMTAGTVTQTPTACWPS